jgi:RimJ/RimL family protein N-acetyltransferase
MTRLTYQRMSSPTDIEIPLLQSAFDSPEVARFIGISENYFTYVTSTPRVHFYKAYEQGRLIGSVHLEQQGSTLYMSVMVFPACQGQGYGRLILADTQNDVFGLGFDRMEVSIDERNTASRRLFEGAGFTPADRDGELMHYVYRLRKNNTDGS